MEKRSSRARAIIHLGRRVVRCRTGALRCIQKAARERKPRENRVGIYIRPFAIWSLLTRAFLYIHAFFVHVVYSSSGRDR